MNNRAMTPSEAGKELSGIHSKLRQQIRALKTNCEVLTNALAAAESELGNG